MKRGELYRIYKGTKSDPNKHRVFLVVSRQTLIDHSFSSVICAPVYTRYGGIHKSMLTDFVGALSDAKMEEVNTALRIALAVE